MVRYKSCQVRLAEKRIRFAPLAQLDRVFDYESKGRGFESPVARQQWKEVLPDGRYLFFTCANPKGHGDSNGSGTE